MWWTGSVMDPNLNRVMSQNGCTTPQKVRSPSTPVAPNYLEIDEYFGRFHVSS